VSTGRDERTVVTNFKTRETVLEFPSSQRTYDTILWSQHLNGKIAALDKEGNTDILSLHPQSTQQVGQPHQDAAEPAFAQPIPSQQTGASYTPRWLHPKCGARFGFGGKLVTFHGRCLKVVTQISTPKEQEVAKKVNDFDQEVTKASANGSMEAIYDTFARQALNPGEKLEMVALKSLATGSRDDLFREFGFDQKKVSFEAEHYLGK
jgi:hypothetical protein